MFYFHHHIKRFFNTSHPSHRATDVSKTSHSNMSLTFSHLRFSLIETSPCSNYDNSRRQRSACNYLLLATSAAKKKFFGKHCNNVDLPFCIMLDSKHCELPRLTHGIVGPMRILIHSSFAVDNQYFAICPPTPCVIRNNSQWRK